MILLQRPRVRISVRRLCFAVSLPKYRSTWVPCYVPACGPRWCSVHVNVKIRQVVQIWGLIKTAWWFVTFLFRWNVQVSKARNYNKISRQIFSYVRHEGAWWQGSWVKYGRQLHDHAFRCYPVKRKLDGLSFCLDASEEKTLLHPLEVEPRFLGHPARNLYRISYPRPKIFP